MSGSRSARLRGASMVDYLIVVGVIALAAIIAFTAFGESTKSLSNTQKQCVQTMGCSEGTQFPSSSFDAAKLQAVTQEIIEGIAESQEPDLVDQVLGAVWGGAETTASFAWSFTKGVVVDGVWGTVTGVAGLGYDLVTDPVGTTVGVAKGVWYVATNPVTVAEDAWSALGKAWDEDPARLMGGIVAAVVPVQKAGQITKLVKYADEAEAAADAAGIAKAAEAAAAAKAGGKVDDAAAIAKRADDCPGGVCTNGSCFGPGTPVVTPDGDKPIETIAPGDLVMARDPETGITAPRKVERLFITPDREVFDLGLEQADGRLEHLVVTPEHPFWREGTGFVAAVVLNPGDAVRTAGGAARVQSLASLPEHITVYNFEVETAHTYFVGRTAAWVHNTCVKPANVGDDVLVPRSDGTTSGGRVVGVTNDGKVIVEVNAGNGQTGTKIMGRDQVVKRREIGEEVGVPRSDGSTSIGKIIARNDDGTVTVQWDQNGSTAQKTVHESSLRDADDVTRTAPLPNKPYADPKDGYYSDRNFSDWAPPNATIPDEGWKLHVSAGTSQSQDVANRVLPELRAMGVPHKVVADPDTYAGMKGGQAGKFITIYPATPEQAAEIARRLDGKLGDLKGTAPVIAGERPLGDSGAVYARYGGFTKMTVTDPRTGRQVDDIRGQIAPPWVKDPFTR